MSNFYDLTQTNHIMEEEVFTANGYKNWLFQKETTLELGMKLTGRTVV